MCVEAVEAIMNLNGISGAYDNWIWPAPYLSPLNCTVLLDMLSKVLHD